MSILTNIKNAFGFTTEKKIKKAIQTIRDYEMEIISVVMQNNIRSKTANINQVVDMTLFGLSEIYDSYGISHDHDYTVIDEEPTSKEWSLLHTLDMSDVIENCRMDADGMKLPENMFKQISDTVQTNGKHCLYCNPVDEQGIPYEVALLGRNRDYILGVMDGYNGAVSILNEFDRVTAVTLKRINHAINPFSSMAVSAIYGHGEFITKEDTQIHHDFVKSTKEMIQNLIDNEFDSMGDKIPHEIELDIHKYPYLDLRCPHCGMVHSFEKHEVPEVDMNCSSCGFKILEYTGVDITKFIYNTFEEPDND